MKNRIKMLGLIAVVAMVGFSMTACGNGVDDVSIVLNQMPQVRDVAIVDVTQAGFENDRIIRWTSASALADYSIVYRQVGRVTYWFLEPSAWMWDITNAEIFNPDGTTSTNPNTDRWNVRIYLGDLSYVGTGTPNSFQIGIMSAPMEFGFLNYTYSIRWLDGNFARP